MKAHQLPALLVVFGACHCVLSVFHWAAITKHCTRLFFDCTSQCPQWKTHAHYSLNDFASELERVINLSSVHSEWNPIELHLQQCYSYWHMLSFQLTLAGLLSLPLLPPLVILSKKATLSAPSVCSSIDSFFGAAFLVLPSRQQC